MQNAETNSINFRPSPNFKHMKKYLKSKFEEMSGMGNNEAEKVNKSQYEHEGETSQQVKASPTPSATSVVHPPLPPDSPPDSPIPEIKQEIIDDDYFDYNSIPKNEDDAYGQYTAAMGPEQEATPQTSGAERTMCRNFVRGTCKKGQSCIFAHELIISQLPGVYTFCRNFQNRQCTFAKCKFVHATVFEKERFYRTGYLPPHTLAHLTAVTPPPPPPPPPEVTVPEEIQGQQGYYAAPVLDTDIGIDCTTIPSYILQSTLAPGIDSTLYAPGTPTGTTTNPDLKRDWSESFPGDESADYTEDDFSTGASLPKKCINCDSNEFRYQYHKNKVENLISATEDIKKKLKQLASKNQRLCTVLMTFFKLQTPTPAPGLSTLTSALEDKDMDILEQFNLLLRSNNRPMALSEEEIMKNMMDNNGNYHLLAKLLMSAVEQPPPY